MEDFTETNRKYFDQLATAYQDRFAKAVKMLSEQTLLHRHWISDRWIDTAAGQGKEIRMLEYACGPGIISLTLAPFLTQVVGIDVSENMVAEYNSNASAAGVSQKVIGHQADLIGDEVPQDSADWTDVDLLVVSMALHHFEYPGQALKKLGIRLKKGGVFYIIDLVPQPGHDHGHNHHGHHGHHHHSDGKQDSHGHEKHQHAFGEAAKTVKTHGFSQDDMQQLFQGAGLTDQINYQVLSSPLEFTKDDQTFFKTVFIARAQRQ